MAKNVKRAVAAIAALLGLALTIGGLWLATRVGSSGTATFTGKPTASGAVLLTPTILNRLDADVTVTAEAVPGGKTWMGVASPSDAEAILGTAPKVTAVGFDTSEFTLELESEGQGDLPALAGADIWRTSATGTGTSTLTLSQDGAPESVVITTDKQRLAAVTVTVERKAWFVQAMVGLLVGLALLVGALLLWRSTRTHHTAGATALTAPEPVVAEPVVTESDVTEPATDEVTETASPTSTEAEPGADGERAAYDTDEHPTDPTDTDAPTEDQR